MFDLIIKNGLVIDGANRPAFKADVGLRGDSIAAVDKLDGVQAGEVIDAQGKVVAPGFIDMHSHADLTLPVGPTADSAIFQGVTTLVTGQCGHSLAPLFPETREEVLNSQNIGGVDLPADQWSTFQSFLDFLADSGLTLNVAPVVGQGTIRAAVMGLGARKPSLEELEAMRQEAQKAMEAGAFGLSTGLIYPPGMFCSTEELIAVTEPVGRAGGIYFTHMRNEGLRLLDSIAEALRIGREAGAAVQISHLKACWPSNWDKQVPALKMIDEARAEGLDVTADAYPYQASSTGLKSRLPQWAQEGTKDEILKRLADPATRAKMKAGMRPDLKTLPAGTVVEGRTDWTKVMISRAPDTSLEGKFVAELAEAAGKEPEEWVFDALLKHKLELGMVTFMIGEDNLRLVLKHPAVVVGSDSLARAVSGPLGGGKPHPRTFGTFPRVLGHYARDEKVLGLEEAVWKMTGFTSAKLRLSDRGLVKKGFKADLTVFDPEKIIDTATYQEPLQYPQGIDYVLVSGQVAVKDGRLTGARPGRILKRS